MESATAQIKIHILNICACRLQLKYMFLKLFDGARLGQKSRAYDHLARITIIIERTKILRLVITQRTPRSARKPVGSWLTIKVSASLEWLHRLCPFFRIYKGIAYIHAPRPQQTKVCWPTIRRPSVTASTIETNIDERRGMCRRRRG